MTRILVAGATVAALIISVTAWFAAAAQPDPSPTETPFDPVAMMTQTADVLPPSDDFDIPPLTEAQLTATHAIYEAGLAQGNRRDSFILIGDSNTLLPKFLQAFASGNYELGRYAYLQPLIDAYNLAGAFDAIYPSAEHGMTMHMLLDPLFVNPAVCPNAHHLLDCALDLYHPSVAIIYMGTYDTCHTDYDTYVASFDEAMRILTTRGVIPILTTYAVALSDGCWEAAPLYTQTIRDMAAKYRVPLIDLQEAARVLPDDGMQADGWHLSWPENNFTSFVSEQYRYGNTLRELLTLEMLYILRRDVMH